MPDSFFLLILCQPARYTFFTYTTLYRSVVFERTTAGGREEEDRIGESRVVQRSERDQELRIVEKGKRGEQDDR